MSIISNETAKNFIDVLNDPERAARFTPEQIGQIEQSLQEYVDYKENRQLSLQNQGLSPGQAQVVQETEKQASDEGSMGTFGPNNLYNPRTLARGVESAIEGTAQLIEGAVNLGLQAGAMFGSEKADKLQQQWYERSQERRFRQKLTDIEHYGETNPFLAEVGLSALVSSPALSVKAASVPRYILYNGLIGTGYAGAALTDEALNERFGDLALGFVGGAGMSVFGARSAAKYYAARTYQRQFNTAMADKNLELEAKIQELLDNEDFGFSVSQITGSRFVNRIEASAYGRGAKEQQNRNINAIWKHLIDKARDLRRGATPGTGGAVRPAADAGEIATEMRATLKQANDAIHKRANDNFATGLDTLSDMFGGEIVLSRKNAQSYLLKLQNLISEQTGRFKPGGNISSGFVKYMNEVDVEVNPFAAYNKSDGTFLVSNRKTGEIVADGIPNFQMAQTKALQMNETHGGFDVVDVTEIFKGINDLLKGRFKVLESADDLSTSRLMGKALYGAFIDAVEAKGNNKIAVEALQGVREQYRIEMLRLQKMEDLAVNVVFGQPLQVVDPDAALDKVLAGGKSAMTSTRDFLETWNPALLDELRSTLLRRAAQRSIVPSSAGVDTAVDLSKLANEIAGPKGIGQLGKGLFDAKTQGELVRLGQALRVIQNNYIKGIGNTPWGLDDVTINVISRSPEFMGRFLARVFASGASMEQALFSPHVRNSLIALAEEGPTSRAGKTAMVTLVRFLSEQRLADELNRQAEKHSAITRALEQRAM